MYSSSAMLHPFSVALKHCGAITCHHDACYWLQPVEVAISKAGSRVLISSVRIDKPMRSIRFVPYPIPDNPRHHATIAIEVATQEEGENLLIITSSVSVRNDTHETIFVAMLSSDQIREQNDTSRVWARLDPTPLHR